MPGRISASSRQSRASATTKSSAPTSRSTRTSTEIPDEGDSTSLRRAICQVFVDSQKSTAGHRKLVITLRKIQEACAYEPISFKKSSREEFEEEDFNTEVVRCVLRVLAVRKAEPVGDRVVRFLGTFLQSASAKDNEIADQGDSEATTLPETPTSRLTTAVLNTLLPLLNAKDRTIRFRATQITSHIINSLDTLDDNLFHLLKMALLKRIHDKEAPVRLQAVYGLGRLAAEVDDNAGEQDSDDEDPSSGVLEKLLTVLQNDPSADVRRNLLLNLPLTKDVLPYLLERARDADPGTRRALYARLLPALGDFRHLSLTHREKLLRWGLRDRDENVRKATARLFRERWIEDCAAQPSGEEDPEQQGRNKQAADPSLDALLELLERIDVVNSGVDAGIAQIAMREFWEGRPDYVDYVSFPDAFWEDLSPEIAFVARTFNDFCRTSGKEDGYAGPRALDVLVEEKLPEVTRFGFLLEREINRLLETALLAASGEDENAEEDLVGREFVVEQMLHMALTFDYTDEVGRRKMNSLMREALALPDLPEESTRLVIEVLRLVCGDDARSESEFCGAVLEAVAEVHDTIMGETDDGSSESADESFHSATSELSHPDAVVGAPRPKAKRQEQKNDEGDEDKAVKEIMVNMKCLHIAQCMLQNVACDLETSVHLVTMLNNLVVPAVRSQEAPIRERGLVCLGLCCLLGVNLAEENLTLFLHCFAKGHPALQSIALQIIADILITHPSLLAEPSAALEADSTSASEPGQGNAFLRPVLKAFSKALKAEDPAVRATGAKALSKTMLSRVITDVDLLRQLVIAYFDPDTAGSTHLRQCLTYFLPTYCHVRTENAARMTEVACGVINKLATLRESYLEDVDAVEEADEMVSLNTIGSMILDWTDPRKIVGFAETVGNPAAGAGETHFLLAENILDRIVGSQVGKDERRVLISMLGKVHLPAGGCGGERLAAILELVAEAFESRAVTDATSRNTLNKLQTQLLKLMHDVATAERGGGGPEETIFNTTELPVKADNGDATELDDGDTTQLAGNIMDSFDEETEDATQLQREMRDTTIGAPDAEGTRVQLGMDDTEMTGITDDE